MTETAFAEIHQAWLDNNGVLRFPCQRLDDNGFLAFAARFGELDVAPINANGHYWKPEYPQLAVISNVVLDGKPVGSLGSYESKWHTDMSYNELPPKASILYAIELPREGGDTGFASTAAVRRAARGYEEASGGLTCKHDSSHNSVGQVRKGFAEAYDQREDIPEPYILSLRCIRKQVGRLCILVGALVHISVNCRRESDALLDELYAHVSKPEFTWTQKWRHGDVVLWDNRCTLHHCRDALDPNERRLLHRAQIKDAAPMSAAA